MSDWLSILVIVSICYGVASVVIIRSHNSKRTRLVLLAVPIFIVATGMLLWFDVLWGILFALSLYVVALVAIIIQHYRSKQKRFLLLTGIALSPVAGILLCCASLWITAIPSIFTFQKFINNFERISHPEQSELIASKEGTGLLVGNSNHCDFFAGQIRWAMLTPQEIEDFYIGQTIPFAKAGPEPGRRIGRTAVDIHTLIIKEEAITEAFIGRLPRSLRTVSGWGIDLAEYPEGTLYVVYAFDIGYEPGPLDFHCH